MCSIFGAIGPTIDGRILEHIREAARDRGRDGGRHEFYITDDGLKVCLGNWRACPTPEIIHGSLQPYNGLIHNGTVANDIELGALPGEIDSQCLARILDRSSVHTLVESLKQVRGSYALACNNGHSVLCAVNYKPLHFIKIEETIYFSSMARHFTKVLPFGQAPVTLAPYTAIDLLTQEIVPLQKIDSKRVVIVASAG